MFHSYGADRATHGSFEQMFLMTCMHVTCDYGLASLKEKFSIYQPSKSWEVLSFSCRGAFVSITKCYQYQLNSQTRANATELFSEITSKASLLIDNWLF